MEQKKTFEPFERIIVKGRYSSPFFWTCELYSHCIGGFMYAVGGRIYEIENYDILPFADNETLVGTSEMPCEDVVLKPMEFIFVLDTLESMDELSKIVLGRFVCLNGDKIGIADDMRHYWSYCIPFSKFNQNDMEETRKHILCVKNGKLVRARV